jgi:hypothetical protein
LTRIFCLVCAHTFPGRCSGVSDVSEALPPQRRDGRPVPAANQAADLHRHFYGGLGDGQPDLRDGTISKGPLAMVPTAPTTGAAHVMLGVEPSAPPAPAMVPVPLPVPVLQLPVAIVATPVAHGGQYYSYTPVAMAEVYVEERNR